MEIIKYIYRIKSLTVTVGSNSQDKSDKEFMAKLSSWFTKSTNIRVKKAESSRQVLPDVLAQTDFESAGVHKMDWDILAGWSEL